MLFKLPYERYNCIYFTLHYIISYIDSFNFPSKDYYCKLMQGNLRGKLHGMAAANLSNSCSQSISICHPQIEK